MSMALSHALHFTREQQADQIYNSCEFYKGELYQKVVAQASACGVWVLPRVLDRLRSCAA
jgi:hypothetical protein